MNTKSGVPAQLGIPEGKRLSFPHHLFLLVRRNLITIFRMPEALLPPIAISVFFLIIAVTLGLQASAVIAGGLLLGLNPATGLAGLLVVVADQAQVDWL